MNQFVVQYFPTVYDVILPENNPVIGTSAACNYSFYSKSAEFWKEAESLFSFPPFVYFLA